MTTNAGAETLSKSTFGFTDHREIGDEQIEIKKIFTPEFRNRLDNPHFEPDLNVDTSCSQWAAVRIVSSLIMVPPQNGERPPLNKSATCQGYSFWKA